VSAQQRERWVEQPPDETFAVLWAQQCPGVPAPRRLTRGELAAMLGREPVGIDDDDSDPRWHISVSCADRLPTWAELVETAHLLRPGVCFVVGVPPRSWWMNVHPYCLHLWETRDANLIAQWRSEARGDAPS
jgi:hypothetical protein